MKKRLIKRNLKKKTAVISLAMMLTSQVSPFIQLAKASPNVQFNKKVILSSNQEVKLRLDPSYNYITNVVNSGTDGIFDIGDIVNYLNNSPSSAVASDVRKMLERIDFRAFANSNNNDPNLAPLIVSSPLITFDPNRNKFDPHVLGVSYLFHDPNGDAL
ncbi:hypothetical protein, partial [Paenibacillus sp. JJ-100]|uniref:hypothetical protein n=1 Tax=Paenibacillus sp. JJ-100 TaxID=2974896 RepID=UPI00232FA093